MVIVGFSVCGMAKMTFKAPKSGFRGSSIVGILCLEKDRISGTGVWSNFVLLVREVSRDDVTVRSGPMSDQCVFMGLSMVRVGVAWVISVTKHMVAQELNVRLF